MFNHHSLKLMNFYRSLLTPLVGILILSSCVTQLTPGVSESLADSRSANIKNLEYRLYFSIPNRLSSPVPGRAELNFELINRKDLVIDFMTEATNLQSITVNNRLLSIRVKNGHINIPSKYLLTGQNKVNIDFVSCSPSLNRKADYLYTLLVPDRASTVFPCFDQPDLKAAFNLTLEIPKEWVAVANAPLGKIIESDTSTVYVFEKNKPVSTYLFAFACGKFKVASQPTRYGEMAIYYRDNDSAKVNRNIEAIYELHTQSLGWMENYTAILYPFSKLDIVLIPDFQYNGMEHPGAIYYRESSILLEGDPSENKLLNRANLIAHEVSHQWFGDLVTMRWFNDVWLKEVFAGLMADKIVNPQFPEFNHQLSFLLSHYPRAYSVDRTAGANPIRQELDNLLNAGSLYGDIIYHKAPIALMQLEMAMGVSAFQEGLRKYLNTYSMGNASWDELIDILDPLTSLNLSVWSKAWIESVGMPTLKATLNDSMYVVKKIGVQLPMVYSVEVLCGSNVNEAKPIQHIQPEVSTLFASSCELERVIVPNADGLGYGMFVPDSQSLKLLCDSSFRIADPVTRSASLISANELFLNGKLDGNTYFNMLLASLARENEPQVRSYILASIETYWWTFLADSARENLSQQVEIQFSKLLLNSSIPADERKSIFKTYARIAVSSNAAEELYGIWSGNKSLPGLTFTETDLTFLAYELAVRNVHNADSILDLQEKRIANPDLLAKFRFVRRALSPDDALRDDFFHSLLIPENRRPEPWVAEALHYFNHPLRDSFASQYLRASLDLLPEIQQTGDIFFPKTWLDAILWGKNSNQAAEIVSSWLNQHPNVPDNLKNKLIQSSDLLFRAVDKRKKK
jgi:aminopeptidase N